MSTAHKAECVVSGMHVIGAIWPRSGAFRCVRSRRPRLGHLVRESAPALSSSPAIPGSVMCASPSDFLRSSGSPLTRTLFAACWPNTTGPATPDRVALPGGHSSRRPRTAFGAWTYVLLERRGPDAKVGPIRGLLQRASRAPLDRWNDAGTTRRRTPPPPPLRTMTTLGGSIVEVCFRPRSPLDCEFATRILLRFSGRGFPARV